MTLTEAQSLIDNNKVFKEKSKAALDYIDSCKFTEIEKQNFIDIMMVLFKELKFNPDWSDFSSLWGSFQDELGSSSEHMEDPEVLKKYFKILLQEFIW
eukprot:CAMPEP_0205805040 /NCGR_PEP_ID=MMETSP0205-20121125/8140_1 /ASSEMBLY_ACC=CAM_ASM_000278 /TAXON_ID=36767 /ORGANISM="Euplotes focardii, Strain TN1" /LENGTH=97 /DNA_ID=CAMNT_0053075613 /DNA_START=23 /DNA_END=313 /DNA_ORIENTATION=-